MIEERNYLHKARYVIPVSSDTSLPEIITDGAVLTDAGVISSVATYENLKKSDAVLVDHGNAVLMPAMVNCHTHLELSCYSALGKTIDPDSSGDMTRWITRLLAARENAINREDREMAAWQVLARMYAGGCRGVADIGNLSESTGLGGDFKVNVSFFLEVLGLASRNLPRVRELLDTLSDADQLSIHAPYSTHPEIIRMVKKRAARLGHIMPIHVAESFGETELLESGNGVFRTFLEERGAWDGTFRIPGKSPVAYLDDLGVLDGNTLCVHCVHVDDIDLQIMADRGVAVCVCPGSNRFLGVGVAPLPKFIEKGLRVVIGTDSFASNPEISIWEEMRLLSESFPDTKALDLIEMATGNGARLFGFDKSIGSLDPGCSSSFLAVTGDLPDDPERVCNWLVGAGLAAETEWVE